MCDPRFGPKCGQPHTPVHGRGMNFSHFCGPEFGKKMQQVFQHVNQCFGQMGGGIPYNLEDRGENYLITVPLAGRSKEEVKVSLIGRTLNITADKPKGEEGKKDGNKPEEKIGGFMRKLFSFVDVNMDIPLPANANDQDIKSVMSNGVLKVKIGKNLPTNIDINDENN